MTIVLFTQSDPNNEEMKKLKRNLENWREIIVVVQKFLLWEKDWHAPVLAGIVNALYFLLWVFEPSVLTVISTIGLALTIADYAGPKVATKLFVNEKWTGVEEKQFTQFCKSLLQFRHYYMELRNYGLTLRDTRPAMFYSPAVGILLLLAWIGNVINNLLIMYLLTLSILLLPGISKRVQPLLSKLRKKSD